MAAITPFHTTAVTTVAVRSATLAGTQSFLTSLGAPVDAPNIFFQRIYGVTVNIGDDGVENLDVLTTVNLS